MALNDNVSKTTKETPFFSNSGKNPNVFYTPLNRPNAEKALTRISDLKEVHATLHRNILRSQASITNRLAKKSKPAPQLKKGDKVYLLTKNLKTKRPSKKLDAVKVGLFLIKEVRGLVNYLLDLLKDTRIHPVFHISLLEPTNAETPV